ncbi:microfibril-associated glycoprotein 4-like [Onychostoma macrolepis]|nr:microfibril-associated glycoprotein 4-like [Onychostoma macrolepis]
MGLRCCFWVPMNVPLVHSLPNPRGIPVDHHDVGTPGSPSPCRRYPHQGSKEEGVPLSGQALWKQEQGHGLENMYQLTRNRKYMLRVDLEDFTGRKGFALYSFFFLDCETDGYKLHVSGFTDGGAGDSLAYHNDQKFSTFDKDQDVFEKNCARLHLGAFWYNNCHHANLNGMYIWGDDPTIFAIGNVWFTWSNNWNVGMKSITMKIKRVS